MCKNVAVILVNWNTPQYTIDCIEALIKYNDPSVFDIILLDNGSTDDSAKILTAKFPGITFINNGENLGFSEGHNRGLNYSIAMGYTYSLIMNTDTLVDSDLINQLLSHLKKNPYVAAVQPAIYWMHNNEALWNGPCYFNSFTGKAYSKTSNSLKNLKEAIEVDWVTGCCFMVKNSTLKLTGLFNKVFFFYFEDVELSFQIRGLGGKLHYLPSAKLYHEAGVTGKSKTPQKEGTLNPRIHFLVSRNHLWFLRRYGKPFFYPMYFIINGAYYLSLLAYFIIRNKPKKRHQLLTGIKEGLFTPKREIWANN